MWEIYSRDGTVEGELQQIGETTHLHGIDFRLKREAVIRGILTGTNGESAGVGVSVTAVRKEEGEQGKVRLRVVNTVKTDASGRFAFTKLESGTYFVCVNGPNGLNAFPDAGGWYRETWYGNDGSANDAKGLTLKEGEEQNDIHIKVEREQRYSVVVWPSGPEDQPNPDCDFQCVSKVGATSLETRTRRQLRDSGNSARTIRRFGDGGKGSEYQGEGDTTFDVSNGDVTLHLHVGGLGEIQGIVKSDDTQAWIPLERGLN